MPAIHFAKLVVCVSPASKANLQSSHNRSKQSMMIVSLKPLDSIGPKSKGNMEFHKVYLPYTLKLFHEVPFNKRFSKTLNARRKNDTQIKSPQTAEWNPSQLLFFTYLF